VLSWKCNQRRRDSRRERAAAQLRCAYWLKASIAVAARRRAGTVIMRRCRTWGTMVTLIHGRSPPDPLPLTRSDSTTGRKNSHPPTLPSQTSPSSLGSGALGGSHFLFSHLRPTFGERSFLEVRMRDPAQNRSHAGATARSRRREAYEATRHVVVAHKVTRIWMKYAPAGNRISRNTPSTHSGAQGLLFSEYVILRLHTFGRSFMLYVTRERR
jgi:hypothetical protein